MTDAAIHISELENIKWENPHAYPFILTNVNYVWSLKISSIVPYINILWPLLNTGEQLRANGYYREKDKHRFIISRAILRILLAKYLSTDAASIIFETGVNKKPHINHHTNIHYNVSHSGNYALIGISQSEIGVDIELTDDDIHYNDIMPITYSEPEIEFVHSSILPIQSFYKVWTRKEAFLKATGKGIDDDIKLIPGLTGTHNTIPAFITNNQTWLVKGFSVANHYIASIASPLDKNAFIAWDNTFFEF